MASTEDNSFEAAVLAGWGEFDLTWERLQENAAGEARDGRLEDAAANWAKALSIARARFEPPDLRLATSVANHARGLRRAGDGDGADRLFREALSIWDSAGPWIETLKVDRRARSSLFHLRMEMRHWDQYEATLRLRLRRFAEEGRTALVALSRGQAAEEDLYARWNGEKPPQFNDSRKLLGAVCLIAPVNRS